MIKIFMGGRGGGWGGDGGEDSSQGCLKWGGGGGGHTSQNRGWVKAKVVPMAKTLYWPVGSRYSCLGLQIYLLTFLKMLNALTMNTLKFVIHYFQFVNFTC